eukprot:1024028-Pyramimonas_sp.AAC.1
MLSHLGAMWLQPESPHSSSHTSGRVYFPREFRRGAIPASASRRHPSPDPHFTTLRSPVSGR